MCGILAQFKKSPKVQGDLFDEALQLLQHRGPDDMEHTLLRDNSLCFGHTRLSIIGLENGRQPLSNQDNTLFAIVNGEFYDYQQIKYDLSLEGYQFKTKTDSEIILALYEKYADECFSKLNGEFAGVIYDVKADKLIIFRDRHGVKPLVFKQQGDGLIISSEIKPILKLDKTQPEWNVDYLKQFFSWNNTQDNTIFKDIYHVKPAHYMIFDLKTSSIAEHAYWRIDFNQHKYFTSPLTSLTKQYEDKFVAAVARRLVADVPVASYLSGGIDSSACYGVASQLLGNGLDAFTISFDNPDYDEFKQAQSLVKKYAGKHHILTVNEQLLFDNFEQHLWFMEGPVFNPHSVAKYLLSKMVREAGFKVVITGEGSDEYNAGYAPSVMDAAKFEYHSQANLPQELLNVSYGAMISHGSKELAYLKPIFGFSPSWYENSAVANSLFNSLYTAHYGVKNPDADIQRWGQANYRQEMQNWDVLNTSLYLTGQVTFAYVLSVLGDRTEMAHSVEARVPFLDHNLLEFLAKVPPKYKATLEFDKFILREAVKKYVTPEHYMTRKHPYMAPPLLIKNSLFANYMQEIFSSAEFINAGLFDHNKVLKLLHSIISENKPNPEMEKHLFKILSFALLHNTFGFKNL